MKTLQEQFVETRGAPLHVNGVQVVQMDRIAVRRGMVSVRASRACAGQGIALKAPSGAIWLSDGKAVPLLHVWFDPGLPLTVTHEVDCRDGELRVWNIFRTVHPNGAVTEDKWTGNAGMAIVDSQPSRRHYRCSPGTAESFNPQLEVTIEVSETEQP
ncbi:MAG: hypothetical protein U5L03_16205 [Burkholderiaceae bacterium]|nr:hypothetical protein [Burkholderiaceae bacterium]